MSLSGNGISRKAYAGVACAAVGHFFPRIIIPKYFDSKIVCVINDMVIKLLGYDFIRGRTLLQPPVPLKKWPGLCSLKSPKQE